MKEGDGNSGKRKLNSPEDRKGTSNWISKDKEDKKGIEMDLTGKGSEWESGISAAALRIRKQVP